MNPVMVKRWLTSVYFSLSVIASVIGIALFCGNLYVDPLRLIELPTLNADMALSIISIVALGMLIQVLFYSRLRPADSLKHYLFFVKAVVFKAVFPRRICFEHYGSRAPPI